MDEFHLEPPLQKITYIVDDRGCMLVTNRKGKFETDVPIVHKRRYYKYAIKMSHFRWFMRYGQIPKNHELLHRCGNPLCININHLELIKSQHKHPKRQIMKDIQHEDETKRYEWYTIPTTY